MNSRSVDVRRLSQLSKDVLRLTVSSKQFVQCCERRSVLTPLLSHSPVFSVKCKWALFCTEYSRRLRSTSQSVQRQSGARQLDDVQQQRQVPVFVRSLVSSWCLRLELNVPPWRSLDTAERRRLSTLVSHSL